MAVKASGNLNATLRAIIAGLNRSVATVAGTATLSARTHGGKTVRHTSVGTLSLPNDAKAGTIIRVHTAFNGVSTFAAQAGGSIAKPAIASALTSSGQDAICELECVTNTTGANAAWVLGGTFIRA